MSSELAMLSVDRAGLPDFPGATVSEQLLAGRNAALAVLRKYVPTLSFDVTAADEVLRAIEAWEERNSAALSSTLQNPSAAALPEQIRLAFGSDKAQQFIIAVFTRAAVGLGPWTSGRVSAEVSLGQMPGVSDTWARTDAAYRLRVFGGIVRMEQTGCMQHFFVDPSVKCGASGLGVAPLLVWAVVVAVVLVAALVLMFIYSARRLDENNRLMRTICERAQADGDKATVAQCVQATKDLQAESMIPGLGEAISSLGKLVGVGLLAYAALKYGPELWKKRRA